MFAKLKRIRVQLPKRLQLGLNQEQREEGVTLIELLAVVVILGIISAIAVPAVSSAINNAKVTATLNDEGTLQVALQRYYNQTGSYPASLTDLTKPITGQGQNGQTHGPYMTTSFPEVDGWGNNIYYAPVATGAVNTGYILLSGDGNNNAAWTQTTLNEALTSLPGSGVSPYTYIYAGGGTTTSDQLQAAPTVGALPTTTGADISSVANLASTAFVDK
ncbi:MAG: type II secretion system protein [Bacilli bacterium]